MVGNRRMWAYGLMLSAAAVVLSSMMGEFPLGSVGVLCALLALTLVLNNLAIELPSSVSLSLMFASVCAGIFYAGSWGGGILGLAGAVTMQELRARKPVELILVNAAQLFLSGATAGWVFAALGSPMSTGATEATGSVVSIVPLAVSVIVFYALNLVLVGVALRIKTGMSSAEAIQALEPGPYLISMFILALLGYAIASLIAVGSWAGLFLLVLPFAMARRTFRVYVELTEAYASTVRSLVTAIEAKDPYTRGHSERVAEYAQAIAGQMGLPQSDVQVLERAALLHDVGKIGISLDTLVSPERLSEDEMRAIRRHPVLGADLVADVEFLHDIVDVVRCHHERCDGGGYPDGILGEDIPLLARILAAADSYDAMTSDRAYRPGMPFDQAIDELQRVAGSQLDERVVASFIDVLRSDELGAMAS